MLAVQLPLVPGLYRCHNCGRDVERVHRVRRWRLCDACYAAIVEPARPDEAQLGLLPGDALWQAREAYWHWVNTMEQRYPSRFAPGRGQARAELTLAADAYYPSCRCGRPRPVLGTGVHRPGLFGGPFAPLCPLCEGRLAVEFVYRSGPRLVPGRDEEEWLDLLQRSHPELFELGILPDYWFELKYKGEP